MQKKGKYFPVDINPAGMMIPPGTYPFLRGIHPEMYSKRVLTMRMFAGYGTAKETNERLKMLLGSGQTGLSTAFDMPTLLGLDSSNPRARGDIGMGGVAVDTIADMECLFAGINLGEVSTSMTVNGSAIVLLAMYFQVARKEGVSLKILRGTIQNDPLKEFSAQKEYIIPPEASVKLLVDTIEYCTKHVPQWNPVSISGYHIREAGSTAVQELAFTLADGIAYVEACVARGLEVDSFAPRLSFFFDFANDWLTEIAKIRAARVLWAEIMRKRFGTQNKRSQWMRAHIQTAGMTLTQEQPLNNIARVAIQALGAFLTGCQSLHTNSYDEQLQLPSEEAVKIALRTQQIIANETGIIDIVDPLGGSYALEAITKDLEEEAGEIIKTIDGMGGMVEATKQGWPQSQIRSSAIESQKRFEDGTDRVVGQNIFADEEAPSTTFIVSRESQDEQLAFLEETKKKRDESAVGKTLLRIERAAKDNRNCMPAVSAAVCEYATVEEICDVFRSVYGTYREDVRI